MVCRHAQSNTFVSAEGSEPEALQCLWHALLLPHDTLYSIHAATRKDLHSGRLSWNRTDFSGMPASKSRSKEDTNLDLVCGIGTTCCAEMLPPGVTVSDVSARAEEDLPGPEGARYTQVRTCTQQP